MQVAGVMVALLSVLAPVRTWVPADRPVNVRNQSDRPVRLALSAFSGGAIESRNGAEVVLAGGETVDVREVYPSIAMAGTYVLWAMPREGKPGQFMGTPLVISVRTDRRAGAADTVTVTKVEPLRFATLETEHGPITMLFYYDVAPHTVEVIQGLMEQGFYEGLTFHRVVKGFVIQGGDPRGDGRGGPGFSIDSEFSDRPHEEGTVSMARLEDPLDRQRGGPRPDYANSAGSQFFITLSKQPALDRRYTAFGKVVGGIDAVKAIAAVPVSDAETGRPVKPPAILKVQVRPVTVDDNPYRSFVRVPENAAKANLSRPPATQPTTLPAGQ